MNLEEKQLSSEVIEESSFLQIYRDKILLPNQRESVRLVIRHPGAATVLAITDDEKVVLVRQWRYAVGGPLLELPAGKLEEGENPLLCAQRELAEETPYTAQNMRLVHTFYTVPGFCNERIYLYLAQGVCANSMLGNDEDEFTETVLMNRDEIKAALKNNEISDAKTLIGLQYWLLNS